VKLFEILGLEKVPGLKGYGQGDYNRRSSRPVGRPDGSTTTIKSRPNKNLWFDDDKLWTQDLDLYCEPNSLQLVTDENEEVVIAKDVNDMVYGKWDVNKKRGITFSKPKSLQHIVSPRIKLKSFVFKPVQST
jgi:hypothetical protein